MIMPEDYEAFAREENLLFSERKTSIRSAAILTCKHILLCEQVNR